MVLEHIYCLPGKDPEGHKVPGVCLRQNFNITQGLATALLKLRYWTHIGWFWIDAISINQSDPWERGKQVSVMGNIYAEAELGIKYHVYVETARYMEMIRRLFQEHSD